MSRLRVLSREGCRRWYSDAISDKGRINESFQDVFSAQDHQPKRSPKQQDPRPRSRRLRWVVGNQVEPWVGRSESWENVRMEMRERNQKWDVRGLFVVANAVSRSGRVPPPSIYYELAAGLVKAGGWGGLFANKVFELVDELELRNKPVRGHIFEQLFKLMAMSADATVRDKVLRLAEKYEHKLRPDDWECVVRSHLNAEETERAFGLVVKLAQDGVRIQTSTYAMVTRELLLAGELELAYDVLCLQLESGLPVPRLWAWLLSLAAREFKYELVVAVWDTIVDGDYVYPDDGTCENVILTGAAAKDPELCARGLRALVSRGVEVSDELLSCLVDAQEPKMNEALREHESIH
ncbi:hypothetical protein V1512DRAFT_250142 [Lipomyces arxii]|uniref:uncharacterized protein n=1 Tax=Lipomyces arxii TaxID=56418 RepID=UPI0034CD1C5D